MDAVEQAQPLSAQTHGKVFEDAGLRWRSETEGVPFHRMPRFRLRELRRARSLRIWYCWSWAKRSLWPEVQARLFGSSSQSSHVASGTNSVKGEHGHRERDLALVVLDVLNELRRCEDFQHDPGVLPDEGVGAKLEVVASQWEWKGQDERGDSVQVLVCCPGVGQVELEGEAVYAGIDWLPVEVVRPNGLESEDVPLIIFIAAVSRLVLHYLTADGLLEEAEPVLVKEHDHSGLCSVIIGETTHASLFRGDMPFLHCVEEVVHETD